MGLVVRGNYVWCLVIFVIVMDFGISRGKEVAFGAAMQATSGRWDNFSGEGGGGEGGGGGECSYYVIMLH